MANFFEYKPEQAYLLPPTVREDLGEGDLCFFVDNGGGKLGHVAIDSTRIAANAATSCTDSLEKLRAERAQIRKNIRRWQQQCASEDPNEGAGLEVARAAMEKLAGQLREIPVRLQRLKKSGMRKLSRTDADSRVLPDRRGFTLR